MTCPSCNAANPAGTRFCLECGTRLGAVPVVRRGTHRRSEILRRVRNAVHRRRAAGPTAAAGVATGPAPVAERRLVIVLFADLVGFTPFAEERDSEDVRETADALLRHRAREVDRALRRDGREVHRRRGHGGVGRADRPRGRRRARGPRRAGARGRGSRPGPGHPGSRRRADRRGGGHARRHEPGHGRRRPRQHGSPSAVGRRAGHGPRRRSRPCAPRARRSRSSPPATSRSRARRPRSRPGVRSGSWPSGAAAGARTALEAPFVGRDDELRLLKDLFHATGARAADPPGQRHGPGRHRQEPARLGVLEVHRRGRWRTVWWHARPLARRTARASRFWALGEMVRRRAGLAADRRRGHDADHGSPRRSPSTSPTKPNGAGSSRRCWRCSASRADVGGSEQLFAAWRTFFERMAETGPVALVFEDLHWADSGLLDFIDHLLEWSRDVPDLHRHAGPARAARAAARLGRRQAQLRRALPRAASGAGHARAPRGPRAGAARERRPRDRRPRRRHPALRGRDGPHARRRGPPRRCEGDRYVPIGDLGAAIASRRRSRRSSLPGSTRSTRPIGRSSATPPSLGPELHAWAAWRP